MEKKIDYKGSVLHYVKTGRGKPVVLLHGFAEDSRIWDGLAADLKEQYQLIIPDIPGSGKSALLNIEKPDMIDYADCIKAILDEESLKAVTMIGHSMGGYITLAFAEKFPEMLHSIGLFHSSTYKDDPEKIETRKKAIGFILEKGAQAFLKTSLPGLFKDPEKHNKEVQDLLDKGKSFKNEALTGYYQAMISRPDRTRILKELNIPFLFIMGEYDKAVPFEHSLQQSQLPSHSYVYILRSSAHMGMLEEKELSSENLMKFLQEVHS